MTSWNASEPANNTKIRRYPEVLTNNFGAIEQADSTLQQWAINLVDRSTIGGPNTPARIDDVGQIYCRNDGTNNELFFLNSENPADETQITKGTPSVGNSGAGYTNNGEFFLPGGIFVKFGTAVGLALTGTITFTSVGLTAFPNNNFVVLATNSKLTGGDNVTLHTFTTTGFSYISEGILATFTWIAIGN